MNDKQLNSLMFIVVVIEIHFAGCLTEWLGWYYVTGVITWAVIKGIFLIDFSRDWDKHVKVKGQSLYTYGFNPPGKALFVGILIITVMSLHYGEDFPSSAAIGLTNVCMLLISIVSMYRKATLIQRSLSKED